MSIFSKEVTAAIFSRENRFDFKPPKDDGPHKFIFIDTDGMEKSIDEFEAGEVRDYLKKMVDHPEAYVEKEGCWHASWHDSSVLYYLGGGIWVCARSSIVCICGYLLMPKRMYNERMIEVIENVGDNFSNEITFGPTDYMTFDPFVKSEGYSPEI